MNLLVYFLLGMLGFLAFILLLVIFFGLTKFVKAIVKWRKGVHE